MEIFRKYLQENYIDEEHNFILLSSLYKNYKSWFQLNYNDKRKTHFLYENVFRDVLKMSGYHIDVINEVSYVKGLIWKKFKDGYYENDTITEHEDYIINEYNRIMENDQLIIAKYNKIMERRRKYEQ